mmetsp:Transcript_34483/g.75479  ORF Transcript_34483/g.75479 Transcript_34483/m.75479 type:complete len:335 (-) Transcript_34483:84-1088(-)
MARVQLAVAAIALAQSAAFSTLPASPPSRAFVVSSRNAPLHVSAIAEPPAPAGNGNQHQQAKKKSSNKKRRKPKAKLVNGDKQVKVTVSKKRSGKSGSSKNGKKRRPRPTLQPLSELKLGSKIDGVVAGIAEFGAFVKTKYAIRGKDDTGKEAGYALLHKSQIQDDKVESVSDVLRVGDQIRNARVVSINYAKGEVGISLRKPRQKRRSLDDIKVGAEYDGKVANVTPYGAFIDIGAKKNALLHVSRISQEHVTNVREYVNEGDWVTVHVISKDDGLACSMLDKQADEYLNKRQKQLQRKKDNKEAATEEVLERSELAAFEEAIKELENAFRRK